MQKKQLKSLKGNIGKIQKMQCNKNTKKQYSRGENYQGDLWQGSDLDGQIKGTTKNIGEDQKEIGDNGKGEK